MRHEGEPRTVTIAAQISYSRLTCDKCGVEWQPPPLEGAFESERAYLMWSRARVELWQHRTTPADWFELRGGDDVCVTICPSCAKAVLPKEAP